MLSRDAEALYWCSRYFERAEHIARLLLVTGNLLTDVGDLAPALQERQWATVGEVMRAGPAPEGSEPVAVRVTRWMALDAGNICSIVSCIARARANARAVRENLTSEMWECVNTLYLGLHGGDVGPRLADAPDDFYAAVTSAAMLFQGLADQTLPHDQAWRFLQLGKLLERLEVTCRIIAGKEEVLTSLGTKLEAPLRNIQWMSLLRTCGALEAYRRLHGGDLDPRRVTAFLLLDPAYPRSVRTCVRTAQEAMAAIRAQTQPLGVDAGERVLGRLQAQLEFADAAEIYRQGLADYLHQTQQAAAAASLAVHRRYFLY
jgi:uncharacterized alpha-E superfamily protein